MEQKIREYMKANHIGGFFVANLQNVRYISNYTSDDAYLLITEKENYFLTDPRYAEQAALECPKYKIINWREKGKTVAETIKLLIEELNIKSFCFEGDFVSYNMYAQLRNAKAEAMPVSGVIEGFRSIKSEMEIECLRAACQIADRAFERIIKDIKVGITEKELASKLSHYMVIEGADTKPYGNILISGKRTSLLHGIPSSKSIEYGDFVLMDYGCGYKGYLSDMTRTVVVGKATPEQKKVYSLEMKMSEDSKKAMVPGARAKDVYEASIKAIKDTEYYQYHYNGIGHGIGLFVHEIPFLSPRSDDVLTAGNVVTIEPGIYIPDWGGVRIEDQILITDNGNEQLTNSVRELIEL